MPELDNETGFTDLGFLLELTVYLNELRWKQLTDTFQIMTASNETEIMASSN